MNINDAAVFLRRVSAYDNRQVTDETIRAWWDVLKDYELSECARALVEHQRSSKEYLIPFHIVERVRSARRNVSERAITSYSGGGDPCPECEHGRAIIRCRECMTRLAEEDLNQ